MDNYVLCGMQYGDEGKGSFVDYLAHEKNIDCVVKYNGGSQASHTVVTPTGVMHKFSQLGAGMFLEKCHTYITENMVVNLENLLVEMEIFSEKSGIDFQDLLKRVHIHEDCYVVTPYHKLLNKLRELSLGKNRRGSVGTGVSEVRYLLRETVTYPPHQKLVLRVKDVFYPDNAFTVAITLQALQEYVNQFYKNNKEAIRANTPRELETALKNEIDFLLAPESFSQINWVYMKKFRCAPSETSLAQCVYSTYEQSFKKNCSNAIFEGSQGLLIDETYGIKPNTTFLDTTNNFALEISGYKDKVKKIGIAKAFMTRHGDGLFLTESPEVSEKIQDENQEERFWNGKIRFGWFDALLLRYAQRVNQVDELYLSSLDKLSSFESIKVCTKYLYTGTVDEEFQKLFTYYVSDGEKIIITDIIGNDENLIKYLKKCTPIYISLGGWQENISNISYQAILPPKCIDYINAIRVLTNIPITAVSVGATRKNKIQFKSL